MSYFLEKTRQNHNKHHDMTSVQIIFAFFIFLTIIEYLQGYIFNHKPGLTWKFDWKSWKSAIWKFWFIHFPFFYPFLLKNVWMLTISSKNPHIYFVWRFAKEQKHFSLQNASNYSVYNEIYSIFCEKKDSYPLKKLIIFFLNLEW